MQSATLSIVCNNCSMSKFNGAIFAPLNLDIYTKDLYISKYFFALSFQLKSAFIAL